MRLNLGCGYRKLEGYINIDNRAIVEPDVTCNVAHGLDFETSSIEEVVAIDFLEHIHPQQVIFVIEEIHRVLIHGGIFHHITPSTDGRGAFQDPTHLSFWNINSWRYYTEDAYRQLIDTTAKFKIRMLKDIITQNELRIIHTEGILEAVKKDGAV